MSGLKSPLSKLFTLLICVIGLFGCARGEPIPSASMMDAPALEDYIIGPGDTLEIFVWRNPDLSRVVPVRPDGKISIPLVDDMEAAGKSSTDLANDIEGQLSQFVQQPRVTVIVTNFIGPFGSQVRFVGNGIATQAAIPYRENMTMLDAVIAVGGLTEFAAGNRTRLSRSVGGEVKEFRVRLDDLLNDGDISANVSLLPGDVIFVPESWL